MIAPGHYEVTLCSETANALLGLPANNYLI
jgi:hypothetical protein